jgi:hypothetical protein
MAARLQVLEHGEQVKCRSGEPVDLGDDDHVAALRFGQQGLELLAIGRGFAGEFLGEHLGAAGRPERLDLAVEALRHARDPCISVDHFGSTFRIKVRPANKALAS